MGPLVPDIIGNELNFVIAVFIGIAFGFILEQAGFSTSKKLVGLFYGYDFTVLRVFFTAGITAMTGVIALSHFGYLDMSFVYVNPTFIYSAVVGGLIMGLGFVIGGYCPGTSFCGAAIGKIDAMIFIGGSVLGVLAFTEGFPVFGELYKAGYWGDVRMFETLKMDQGLFAFLLTGIALFAFWITTVIENKVNNRQHSEFKPRRLYMGLTGLALLLGAAAMRMPEFKSDYLTMMNDADFIAQHKPDNTSIDELAFRILDNDKTIQLFDLRSEEEYKKMRLPGAVHITPLSLFEREISVLMTVKNRRRIFYADDEDTALRTSALAASLGYKNVHYLKGGLTALKDSILNFHSRMQLTYSKIPFHESVLKSGIARSERDKLRFREHAAGLLPGIIAKASGKTEVKKKIKKVQGGC